LHSWRIKREEKEGSKLPSLLLGFPTQQLILQRKNSSGERNVLDDKNRGPQTETKERGKEVEKPQQQK